jgi:hypothetical protein
VVVYHRVTTPPPVDRPHTSMNSAIVFPPVRPPLKLTRSSATTPPFPLPDEKWAATLTEERRRLHEDQEALRVREANLREYEDRLRALQAEIEAGGGAARPAPVRSSTTPFVRPSTKAPFESDAALQSAWEKLHRARELLEAEQNHLRDERIILQDQQNDLQRRDEAVTAREAAVTEREQLLLAAAAPVVTGEPIASEHTRSAVTRFTRAPFDMARSVFGGKK